MRVVFVYKYLTVGGVEAVLRARLEGLPALGIDAQAWFLVDGEGRTLFHGLEARTHVGPPAQLNAYLDATPTDVVSSIDTEEILPLFEHAERRERLIVEVHSPYLENLEYLRRLNRGRVAVFFVPSRHQGEVARKRLGAGAQIRVVPNPVRSIFCEEPEPFQPRPPRPIIAWIGRLDSLKNWKGFLALARGLLRSGEDVEFWMVGDPPGGGGEAELLRAASRAGVLRRLRWFWGFPHERMPTLFDAVRESGGVVVSTSRGESFGMAMAEAMARECAVVAPALGPFPEYVAHAENRMLYPARSVGRAVAAVQAFLREPELRRQCGRRARDNILRLHCPERAVGELVGALQSACSSKG
jgi:glycosyltransferase involved in cell wall biosynthesis